MQTRHLLITLLVVAHVLVGLVAWSMGEFAKETFLLIAVVAISQVGLLAIWLALGRRAAPWRLVALIGTIVGWSWILSSIQGEGPETVVFLLPLAATVAAILALARSLGLQLYVIDAEPTKIEDNRPWQFTLARLFAWTTSLAICLGLLSLTFRHCKNWNHLDLYIISKSAVVWSAVMLICLWATLTDHGRRLLAVMLLVILFVYPTISHPDSIIERYFFVQQIAMVVASLLVFRVAGYRLGWKRKES